MIRTEGLTKIYRMPHRNGIAALNAVSLTISRGHFVLISGPSGSGKSTLLHLLGLLSHPSAGRVFFCGEEVTDYSEEDLCRIRRQKIGYIFQGFNLLPRMAAWENAAVGLVPLGVPEKERFRRASALLQQLGLHTRLFHRPEELSGGEQQRVCVARALINDPEIVFADEPTSNIDAASAMKVLQALGRMRERGGTVVLVTHEADLLRGAGPEDALNNPDAVYRLLDGKLEESIPSGGRAAS